MLMNPDLEQAQHKFQKGVASGTSQEGPVERGVVDGNLEFQLITDFTGFEALESEWCNLFERAGGSHQLFQSYNWCWHWCQTYLNAEKKRNPIKLSIVVGRVDDLPVMIWPLITDRSMGVRYACWMGMPVSQYSDVLVEQGPNQMAWLIEGWQFICSRLSADLICLPKVRGDSALSGLLRRLSLEPVQQNEAPYADLSKLNSYEEYASRFSARLRKNRRRQHRRLSEQGEVSVEILTDGKEACAVVDQAIEMKCRWLQNQGLVSKAFADDRIDQFFSRLLTTPDRDAGCQVSVLKVGKDIAAVMIGILCKGRYATHICAYNPDPQFVRSGAGSLLMDATVQTCLNNGLSNFDMMAPGDAYKYEWADATVMVNDYSVPLTPRGRAFAVFGACTYSAKAAFETTPQRLRRFLLAIAGPRR